MGCNGSEDIAIHTLVISNGSEYIETYTVVICNVSGYIDVGSPHLVLAHLHTAGIVLMHEESLRLLCS